MATRGEQQRAAAARTNSAAKRAASAEMKSTNPGKDTKAVMKAGTAASPRGRALHGRTKLQADAKAGKPDPGRVEGFFKTGSNGGEAQTFNGVTGTGRGSDGAASVHGASRKSTRGGVPGGEKPSSQKTRNVVRETYTPERRAARNTARNGPQPKGTR